MSSGNLPRTQHPELFRWSDQLDPARYVYARYRVTSQHDGEATAMGMAMEQSAATTSIRGYLQPEQLRDWTIRVLKITAAPPQPPSEISAYQLNTEVYAQDSGEDKNWLIELAIPLCALQGKPAQLFNVISGELPRLGFLTRYQLESCKLPADFGPGPSFGAAGIRARFARPSGPLICRSMRPAVGLDTATMARLNSDVLSGGFHMVKDDELQCFADLNTFKQHLVAMVAARDRARDHSGEFKGYIANLICEPDELLPRWELCQQLGVDAVLLAPFIQGFGTLAMLAKQKCMPLLAHNSFGDLLSRHRSWGLADAVLENWQESLGADWVVTHGAFADSKMSSSNASSTDDFSPRGQTVMPRAMPIIQGGKTPEGLPAYRSAIGSDDYMLIVASWVDSHPDGLQVAARIFRDAIDQQSA